MDKVVGVIPARWQSSRFPGKPLVNILGKSLIQRTYENAKRCSRLDALVIATDDKRIFDHAQGFGAQTYMTSPECATGTDRVWEVVSETFPDAEVVVNVQGDEPCLESEVIDQLVVSLHKNPKAAMTTPVSLITDPQRVSLPHVVKCVFDRQGRALYFSRSPIPFTHKGEYPPHYYRHLGVYCFRKEALRRYVALEQTPLQEREDLEQLKMLENGLPIYVCVVDEQATGVDTPADVTTIERILWQKENMCSSLEELSPR